MPLPDKHTRFYETAPYTLSMLRYMQDYCALTTHDLDKIGISIYKCRTTGRSMVYIKYVEDYITSYKLNRFCLNDKDVEDIKNELKTAGLKYLLLTKKG